MRRSRNGGGMKELTDRELLDAIDNAMKVVVERF